MKRGNIMFKVDFEMLPGMHQRTSKITWTIELAHQIAHDAIEKGGYKDVKIYDLSRHCGELFYIEHYYLGLNGWEIE